METHWWRFDNLWPNLSSLSQNLYWEEGRRWTSLGCIPLLHPTNIPASKRCCAKSFVIIFACECVIVVLPNSFVSKQIWRKPIGTCSTIKVKNCWHLWWSVETKNAPSIIVKHWEYFTLVLKKKKNTPCC